MKRRAMLVRTATTAMSAGLYTAVGWLMGSRTLTMHIKPAQEPPCCGGGVQYIPPPLTGPFCINIPQNCGSIQWGDCAADCYRYYCNSDSSQWCYTYCLDIYAHCCWYTECPTP